MEYSNEQLYEMLYGANSSGKDRDAAREQLATMSNEDWSDFIAYRRAREGQQF